MRFVVMRFVTRFLVTALLSLLILVAACGKPTTEPTPAPTATAAGRNETATPAALAPTATVELPPTSRPEPAPTEVVAAEPAATFEETACPFDVPEDQSVACGFVVVPEDHRAPDGPTIRIAVAVFRDERDAHRPDPVMVLSGGPGEKTVAQAPRLADLLESLHPHRDLIIFDQRGAGLSEPALECPEMVETLFDLLDEADPEVFARTSFDALMACRDRLMSEGHNLPAYNTVQSTADVDDIRVALGYDQVNLFGASYGSLLAQATMRDHPEGIRSVVIDSVLPLEKSFFIGVSTTAANAVVRLVDACAADNACDAAYPDLQHVLLEVIDRLNAEPIPIEVTNPLDNQRYDYLLTGDRVFGNLVVFLYEASIIPVLPQAITDVHEGDYELMAQLSGWTLALYDALSRGMEFSVFCTDDLIGRTPKDYLAATATLPRQLAGRTDPEIAIEYGFFAICDEWPIEAADPSVKEPVTSDIPTLVLAGEFDPVTPPEYGRLVAENLSNGTFLEFPGVGHGVNTSSACARSITADFLDDPAAAPDTTCIAEMPSVVFDLPAGDEGAPALVPVELEDLGLRTLVPERWTEAQPGMYARGETAIDSTLLMFLALPGQTTDEFLANVTASAGLGELQRSDEREANGLTWSLYEFTARGASVAIAVTAADGGVYAVGLETTAEDFRSLHDGVYLPAIDALVPIE